MLPWATISSLKQCTWIDGNIQPTRLGIFLPLCFHGRKLHLRARRVLGYQHPQPMVFLVSKFRKKSQTMAGRKRVAEIDTTKERVSLKSSKQCENISLVPTSVASKGLPAERSRRFSSVPLSGGEVAAENRCAGQ